MRILAFDESTSITGFAFYEDGKLKNYGLFNFKKEKGDERTSLIKSTINDLIDEFQPDIVGIEDVYGSFNMNTFKILAMLLGVLSHNLYEQGMDYEIVHNKEWRKTCGVKGKKREEQKQSAKYFVKRMFDIDCTEDESDAICIGYHLSKKYLDK